ncbi:MAG: T9SS type A sorting domain-containing protein [Chitinophagales bacterium]|nr:T9SS type A sorting domain-containing protein [Chitinophagales bacterium]MDW8273347.1 T9SS type A sorting domain-containing protein [Chitinophagales bacterium]
MKKLIPGFFLWITIGVFAQDYTLSITYGGKQRTFILHTPCKVYNCSGKKIPLLFAFHGLTESGQLIRDYSQFNKVADTAGFAVVYPNGINNRWNVGFPGTVGSGEDDLGFANALIDYFIANSTNCDSNICAELDTTRIYACGMSNGGFFSYLLACQLSHRIAAIASVTGSMTAATYDSCRPKRPVPVLQIHGTSDAIVPYNGGGQSGAKSIPDGLAFWVGKNSCAPNPVTQAVPDINTADGCTAEWIRYTSCSAGASVEHFKVTGGGHTWPDMVQVYPEVIVGKTNRDFNASVEIWRFFRRFSLAGNISSVDNSVDVTSNAVFYPNPAENYITLAKPGAYRIFDVTGRILKASGSVDMNEPIYLDMLQPGIYVLETQEGNRKLVKK